MHQINFKVFLNQIKLDNVKEYLVRKKISVWELDRMQPRYLKIFEKLVKFHWFWKIIYSKITMLILS